MLACIAAALLLAVSLVAQADVAVDVSIIFDKNTAVAGETGLTARVRLIQANNDLNTANFGHGNNIGEIRLTPSCGVVASTADCPALSVDTGIIALSATAIGSGDCGGVTDFEIGAPDATGQVLITPTSLFVLPQDAFCFIDFTYDVIAKATKDADPVMSGMQTAVLADVAPVDVVTLDIGTGFGSDTLTFPEIATTPGPGSALAPGGAPPATLTDTATLSGLVGCCENGLPAGTVTFRVFPPEDPTCAGAPYQTESVNVSSCTIDEPSLLVTCSTSAAFTADRAGTWHWQVDYDDGPGQNPQLVSACASEPVVVGKANPTFSASPNPSIGVVLQTPLREVVTLGGFAPTGDVEVKLYPPADPTCVGAPLFSDTFAILGNGAYPSAFAPAALITVPGIYRWTAAYSGDVNNLPRFRDCFSAPVQVVNPTTLSITKIPDGATIDVGDTATFTITVTNTGAAAAVGLSLTDPLPAGALLTWQTATPDCTVSGVGAAQTLQCFDESLPAGDSFVASVSALTAGGSCTVMASSATAQAINAAAVSNGGSITCQQPLLSISKTPDNASVVSGQSATFSITVTNNGPGVAGNVAIDDPLPQGALLAWTTSSPGCVITGAGAAQTLSCQAGNLGVGASFAASVSAATGVGKCPATIGSTATAQGSNTAAASDAGSIACQQPVLAVTKTPDAATISSGDAATFSITVVNNGPGAATNVTLSDPLPQAALLTWTTSSAGCAVAVGGGGAQTLSCQAGNLAPGASFTATVSAATGLGTCPATIANTAFATGTNTAEASDGGSIGCQQPVLSLAKTPDGATITAGETATFTITVTNQGPGTATSIVLSDPLPQGALLAWQTTTSGCAIAGSGAGQALSCTVPSLAAGASFAASVAAVTGVGKCPAAIDNAATAKGGNTVAVGDSGSIACQQPVLAVSTSPDGAIITAGETAAFTIEVTNDGPGSATNVVVSDPLPQGALLAWQTTSSGCAITGSGAAQALSCTLASLPANATFTASVSAATGIGKCPPSLASTATATGSNAAAASDGASIACQQPVLEVVKTPDGAIITAGESAAFTITVTNHGPGTANIVVVDDPLPHGALLAWQTATPGCAITGTAAAQALSCTVASLAASASFAASVSARTAVGRCPVIGNTATATGSNTAAASDTGSITCRTPPVLARTSDPPAIGLGGTTTLTYTLTNVAGSPAQVVDFVDLLPSTLRVAASAKIGGTCPNALAATTATPGASTIAVAGLEVPPGPSSCTVTVVLTNAPGQTGTCPAPGPSGIVSSSNVLVASAADACVVVKTYASELGVTTLATLTLGDGTGGIATDPLLRRAYVTNALPPSVSVIDLDALAVLATIALPGQPGSLVADAATGTLYVVSGTAPGAVIVVDALTYAVVATIPVGDHPQGIAVDFQRGEIYVTNRGGNSLSIVDTATGAVAATVPGIGRQPGPPAVDARLGKVYVPSALDNTVVVIDVATRAVRALVPVGRKPGGAAVSQALHRVYVNNVDDRSVSVIDGGTDAVIETISPIGAGSMPALVSDVYRRAYVPNAADGSLSIIDTVTAAIVKTLAVGAAPQQAAIDPDKGDVYVVNRQSNTVSVIDALTSAVVATFGVGAGPWSVAVAPDRLLVLNDNGAAADTLTIAFDGGTQQDTVIATELHSRDFDHYDHTVNSLEARLVSDGVAGDAWTATGEYFRVWTAPGAGRSPMCMFSTAGYGAKDSSYYTPYAQECAELRSSAAWYDEGTGYYVTVPDASGACPSATAELYLLYNNQQGGAPNWRYTGSRATRDAMVVDGWTARGTGAQRVFACTPPLAGTPASTGRRERRPSMLVEPRPRFAAEYPIREHRVGKQDR